MSCKRTKVKEVFFGILTAIGLWLFGILLSGRIAFGEELELYPGGPLVFIFPFAFAAVCILIAKYAVKNKRYTYFIASIVGILSPLAFGILILLLSCIMQWNIPVISFVADIITIVFVIPCVAPISIFSQMLHALYSLSPAIQWCLMAADLIPIVVGLAVSIRIVAKRRKSN